MVLLKFAFVIFIAFLITPRNACERKHKHLCANGEAPLEDYFCGRGPNRQDSPSTHECVIAANDAYAVCCPRSQQVIDESSKPTEKSGSCPKQSNSIGICIARCDSNDNCPGNQKYCVSCLQDCVLPV